MISFVDPDECVDIRPCHNGATCVNQAGGYVCQCPPEWTGKDCNIGKIFRYRKKVF